MVMFTYVNFIFLKFMKKISAVIVAHNEEKKIRDCLKSLYFVDEIVVVLDRCNDKTKEIALEYNAIIQEGSWEIEGARRNIALNLAQGEWILEIDADERVSEELKNEIIEKIRTSNRCGFNIGIANYVGKRWIKFGWLRTIAVLKRNSLSYRGIKKYHEDKQIHPTCFFDGKIYDLENYLIHLVDDDIADLLARFNRYTNWKANDMVLKNKKLPNIFKLICSVKWRFCKSYIFKKGYKEGVIGILIAILCAIYPLVSYLKFKEIKNENC